MDFSKVDVDTYDKYTFGKCIRQQREDVGLSLRSVASNIGISAAYLSEIELGKRYAPTNNSNIIYKLLRVLEIPEEQVCYVMDMAYTSRDYYKGIVDYVSKDEKLRKFIRIASLMDLSDDDWNELFKQLYNSKNIKKAK